MLDNRYIYSLPSCITFCVREALVCIFSGWLDREKLYEYDLHISLFKYMCYRCNSVETLYGNEWLYIYSSRWNNLICNFKAAQIKIYTYKVARWHNTYLIIHYTVYKHIKQCTKRHHIIIYINTHSYIFAIFI